MYTFFITEERYAVERRKLPAFCRVKRPSRNKKPSRENFPAADYIAILNF